MTPTTQPCGCPPAVSAYRRGAEMISVLRLSLLIAALAIATGCKRSENAAPTTQASPSDIKAAADRQRDNISKTAEALRAEEQKAAAAESATPSPNR